MKSGSQPELAKIAYQRLYPSLRNPNYLVLRSRRLIFTRYISDLPANLMILDVGGRYQPYRPLFAAKINKYFALDMQKTEYVSVVGSGESIPFRDSTFDVVIATQVFDCFRDPYRASGEVHRVLKSGGMLLASVASISPRFADEERWRFLPLGLRSLFSQFAQLGLVPEVSSVGGFCRLLNVGFHDFLKCPPLKFAYEVTVCPLINVFGLLLEGAHFTANDRWTGNYTVIAVK